MWHKRIGPDWSKSLVSLTPDQRAAIQALASRMERDPSDDKMRPVFLAGRRREVETRGVWVRYELREDERVILFILATKL